MDDDDEFERLITQIDDNEVNSYQFGVANTNMDRDLKLQHGGTRKGGLQSEPVFNKFPDRISEDVKLSFCRSTDSSPGTNFVTRRFPGPAGILPPIKPEELKFVNLGPHPLCQEVSRTISQSTVQNSRNKISNGVQKNAAELRKESWLDKAPWKILIKSLKLAGDTQKSLLDVLNIKYVRTKLRRLPGMVKIPFLAAVVQEELDTFSMKPKLKWKSPSIKLIDPTGTIVAAVDKTLVEEFGAYMIPGTAIAFRNCGILKFNKQVLLTVTKKNLLCLVTAKSIEKELGISSNKEFPDYQYGDGVCIVQMARFSQESAFHEYENLLALEVSTGANQLENKVDNLEHRMFTNVASLEQHTKNEGRYNCMPVNTEDQVAWSAPQFMENSEFDDDDDDEILQALENVDFLLDEDSF